MNEQQKIIPYHLNRHSFGFHTVPKCPGCQTPLAFKHLVQDQFPYTHVDLTLACLLCGEEYVFGIGIDKSFGLELIVWDTNRIKVVEQAEAEDVPICPFHMQYMMLTKIFGDLLMEDQKYLKLQWKCPNCQLTEHRDIKRFEPGQREGSVLAPHIQDMRAKLEAMGYL